VAAYPVFVYVVSRAGRQVQLVHLLVVWWLVNIQDAWCNNKDNQFM